MMGDSTKAILDPNEPPMVVGTVSTAAKLRELSAGGTVDADNVELRMDLFGYEELDWENALCALDKRGVRLLLTLRHKDEGGKWDGSPVERMELLRPVLPFAYAVDVEIGTGGLGPMQDAAEESDTCLIGSFHDFEKTPAIDVLSMVVEMGVTSGADLVKIATWTEEPSDVNILTGLLEKHAMPLCVLGMGTLGPATRVEFPGLGSRLTYGYLDESAASGQIYAGDLLARLRDP